MPYSRPQLLKALEISREMHLLGNQEDWEKINQMDEQLTSLLKSCLDEAVPESEKTFAIGILRQIQEQNNSLIEMAGKRRSAIVTALKLLHKRKEASAAYQETTDAE